METSEAITRAAELGMLAGQDLAQARAQLNAVYIAGPMTGLPEFNYPAFNAVAAQLRSQGCKVVNPAEQDTGSTGKPWEFYMRLGLRGLLECDAMVLLPGWRKSRGARIEHQIACELGMYIWEWA